MSVSLMSRVWQTSLDRGEQAVLLVLADHADDQGQNCFPSIPLIAWKTGYSVRQVQRILAALTVAQVLEIVAPATNRRPTEYAIHIDNAKPKRAFGSLRGDMVSPQADSRGDMVSPLADSRGDISDARGDISDARGDIGSHTREEPPIEPPIEPTTLTASSPDGEGRPSQSADGDLGKATADAARRGASRGGAGQGGAGPDGTPTAQQKVFEAVCWVVGWDTKTLSKEQRGQVAQTVGVLAKAGYGLEEIRRFWREVWVLDWRYKRDKARPTLLQLRAEIGKVRTGWAHGEEMDDGAGTQGSGESDDELRRRIREAKRRGREQSSREQGSREQGSREQGSREQGSREQGGEGQSAGGGTIGNGRGGGSVPAVQGAGVGGA